MIHAYMSMYGVLSDPFFFFFERGLRLRLLLLTMYVYRCTTKNYMAVMRGFATDRQDKAGQGS